MWGVPTPGEDQQHMLRETLRPVFRVSVVFAFIVVFAVFLRIAQFGFAWPHVVQLAALCGIIAVNIFPGQDLRRRWLPGMLAGLTVFAVMGMYQFGASAPAVVVFILCNALAVGVGGAGLARIVLALQIVIVAGFSIAFLGGWILPRADQTDLNASPGSWIVLACALLLAAFMLVNLVEAFRRYWRGASDVAEGRKEQIDALFELAPEGIAILNEDTGRFVTLNPEAERILDAKRDDLKGTKGLLDVSAPRQAGGSSHETILHALMREALDGGAPRFEWILQDTSGREVPCEISLFRLPSPDGKFLRVTLKDISERTAADHVRDLMALVFRTSSEGMILCDADGTIEDVNPAIERDFGHAARALRGLALVDLLAEESREEIETSLRETGETGPQRDLRWNGEAFFVQADGTKFPGWVILNAVRDGQGRLLRFVLLLRNLRALQEADEEIRRRSELDFLTGLPNRLSLNRQLQDMLESTDETASADSVVLLVLDIDELKQVNDRYGNAVGDAVLCQLADRLRRLIGPRDLLARHSGDEFAILLAGSDVAARSKMIVNEVRNEIARPFQFDNARVHLGASFGAARWPEHALDVAGLIGAADQALFAAKAAGGDAFIEYSPEIGRRAHDRARLMNELQDGLQRGEFRLHYQPVVELETGRLAKVEALARWHHPELGQIGPDRFIPLAEKARMIDPVGEWAMAQCAEDLPRMRARFGADFQASINVSPLQLARGGAMRTKAWQSAIAAMASGGSAPILEITESAFLDTNPVMVERLAELRNAGAEIALDDFGAGHTSLLYYLSHDFEFLKIDREFVRNLPESQRALALCETILGFARRLGAISVAEGIETPEQLEALRNAGCQLGQGYLFSQPRPLDELLELPERFTYPGMPAAD